VVPVTPQVRSAQARVELTEVDSNILKFTVFNLSDRNMVILRDQMLLKTPSAARRRESGGVSSVYNVPAGGAQDINVKFDMSGTKPGDLVEVHFENALLIADKPVQVPPIVLRVQCFGNDCDPHPSWTH
jgi:hypothetical protein